MPQKVETPTNKTSFEQTYLALTEYLVRHYGLSLSFLAGSEQPAKPPTPRPKPTYQPTDLLTPEQAAAVLGLSPKTLANWRVSGIPALPYRQVGRAIRYQYADLLAFAEGNRRFNTSQEPDVK